MISKKQFIRASLALPLVMATSYALAAPMDNNGMKSGDNSGYHQPMEMDNGMGMEDQGPMPYLMQKLQLTQEQQEAISKKLDTIKTQMDQNRDTMRNIHDQLSKAEAQGTFSGGDIASLAKQQGEASEKMVSLMMQSKAIIYANLTKEQQQMYLNLLKERQDKKQQWQDNRQGRRGGDHQSRW